MWKPRVAWKKQLAHICLLMCSISSSKRGIITMTCLCSAAHRRRIGQVKNSLSNQRHLSLAAGETLFHQTPLHISVI